jgi:hypothetical protein
MPCQKPEFLVSFKKKSAVEYLCHLTKMGGALLSRISDSQ